MFLETGRRWKVLIRVYHLFLLRTLEAKVSLKTYPRLPSVQNTEVKKAFTPELKIILVLLEKLAVLWLELNCTPWRERPAKTSSILIRLSVVLPLE